MSITNSAPASATLVALEPERAPPDTGVIISARGALRSLAFGAPLHPILVHYTISLTSASLLFDLLGRLLHARGLAAAAWWTLALGVIATVATLATGVASRLGLDIGEGEARSYLRLHMALGPTFFGMLSATAIWRARLWQAGREVGWWYLAALAVTVAVMTAQGYSGGELVYRWGANVQGRYRDLRQRHASAPPPRLPGAVSNRAPLREGAR
ncbi:MAG TPA: DUF2231 domain-containing protein [Gemmatimonadaceae bacterium]|nr:DUF2231 domain-containing protein [Gemmatimonadaceae bacterium]